MKTYCKKSEIGDIVCTKVIVVPSSFDKYKKFTKENPSITLDNYFTLHISLNDFMLEEDYENLPSKLIEYIKKAISIGAEILYIVKKETKSKGIPKEILDELKELVKDDPYDLSAESFYQRIVNTLNLNRDLPRYVELCEMVSKSYSIPIELVQKIEKHQNS